MILYSVGEELCGIVLFSKNIVSWQHRSPHTSKSDTTKWSARALHSSKSALRRYNVPSLPQKLRLRRQNVPNPKRTYFFPNGQTFVVPGREPRN